MPIYEYACKKCGHTLDALQKMSDDSLVECPECAAPELKRLVSAPRFRLKGEGWYETDFKQDNKRNLSSGDAESAKSDKPDKADKSDGKSDTSKSDTKGKPDKAAAKTEKKMSTKSDDT